MKLALILLVVLPPALSNVITEAMGLVANVIPEETLVANVIPEKKLVSSVIPEKKLVANVIPEKKLVANVIPEKNLVANVIPEERLVANVIPEKKLVANVIPEKKLVTNVILEKKLVANVILEKKLVANVIPEERLVANVIPEKKLFANVIPEKKPVANVIPEEIGLIINLERGELCLFSFQCKSRCCHRTSALNLARCAPSSAENQECTPWTIYDIYYRCPSEAGLKCETDRTIIGSITNTDFGLCIDPNGRSLSQQQPAEVSEEA